MPFQHELSVKPVSADLQSDAMFERHMAIGFNFFNFFNFSNFFNFLIIRLSPYGIVQKRTPCVINVARLAVRKQVIKKPTDG